MNETSDIVYLDYAASYPPDATVIDAMIRYLAGGDILANPSSLHPAGRRADAVVQNARAEVAALLGASPEEIVFTSGATESNNLAILGTARMRAHRGRHLVSMRTEHKAVADCFAALEREGFEVTWLTPRSDGLLDTDSLRDAIRGDTQLVSIMHVNNETGVVQDVETLAGICQQDDVVFHCDAAQSVGKLPLDMASFPADLLSLTAHKFGGPQGVGALYVRRKTGRPLWPIMHGGGQELSLRPGTLPVHQIHALGSTARLAAASMQNDREHCEKLRNALWDGIRDLPGILRNGGAADTYAGILNVSIEGVDGESLLLALSPLCVARGSACNSRSGAASYVLRALGRNDRLAQSAIRFSFGRTSTMRDIEYAIERYRESVTHLRSMSPAAMGRA